MSLLYPSRETFFFIYTNQSHGLKTHDMLTDNNADMLIVSEVMRAHRGAAV